LKQCGTEKRQALGEKSLLGAQPKRAPGARGEESRAVGAGVWMRLPVDGANVFVGRAVAVFAVLRAHAVAVLRNFASDPIRVAKGADHVADQLRLADAAR